MKHDSAYHDSSTKEKKRNNPNQNPTSNPNPNPNPIPRSLLFPIPNSYLRMSQM